MNFLKKLFGKKEPNNPEISLNNPDNTKLHFLLNNYGQNPSNENYKAVMAELLEGNSFLLLPSENDAPKNDDWTTLEKGTILELKSVFNLDGLKVLGAFSDKDSLTNWAKHQIGYTAMRSQDIINMCKENGIDRIVINSDQKNMYVLERNRENITSRTIKEETKVTVGTPTHPLKQHIIDKLKENFAKVNTIEEAYQFAQNMNGETSIVLGILLTVDSDNSKAALHNALNNALVEEELELPLDIMILNTQEWLNTARNINNSLFYKR